MNLIVTVLTLYQEHFQIMVYPQSKKIDGIKPQPPGTITVSGGGSACELF